MIANLLKGIFEFLKRNPVVLARTAQAVPIVVQQLSEWLSRATYAEAVKKVAEVELHDTELLWKIYQARRDEMSAGVRERWEERLRALGKLR